MWSQYTTNGYMTTETNVAAMVMASEGVDITDVQAYRVEQIREPAFLLRSKEGKMLIEYDPVKATEKVRKFGFELEGPYVPDKVGKVKVAFHLIGDPDKIKACVSAIFGHGKRLKLDAVKFVECQDNLRNMIRSYSSLLPIAEGVK